MTDLINADNLILAAIAAVFATTLTVVGLLGIMFNRFGPERCDECSRRVRGEHYEADGELLCSRCADWASKAGDMMITPSPTGAGREHTLPLQPSGSTLAA